MKEIVHLTNDQIVDIIQGLPFFAPFDAAEQSVFARHDTRIFCYTMGEFLIQEGNRDRSFFMLLAGAASVVKEGTSIPLAILGPGQLFGEVAFLTQRNRTSNVIVHPPPQDMATDPFAIAPAVMQLSQEILGQNPPATAITVQWDQSLLEQMPRATRIKLKDQIIQRLVVRVETMNERIIHLTGQDPLLPIDEELDGILLQKQPISAEAWENTQGHMIEQLVVFVEELNRYLVLGGSVPHG